MSNSAANDPERQFEAAIQVARRSQRKFMVASVLWLVSAGVLVFWLYVFVRSVDETRMKAQKALEIANDADRRATEASEIVIRIRPEVESARENSQAARNVIESLRGMSGIDVPALIKTLRESAPTGTILAHGLDDPSPPPGWLFCHGGEINETTLFAEDGTATRTDLPLGNLYRALGRTWGPPSAEGRARLPNLRGLFLRGANNGREGEYADSIDRAVGTLQRAKSMSSLGFYIGHREEGGSVVPSAYLKRTNKGDTDLFVYKARKTGEPGPQSAQCYPRNAAVNWIIRY